MTCRVSVSNLESTPSVTAVQLDFQLELWAGQIIVDSCHGVGSTRDEAVRSAFNLLSQSTLPPLSVSLFGLHRPAIRKTIEVDGVERTVTWSISSVPLSQTETSRPWLQAFEATLSRSTIPTGLHWVRVTHIQLDRNPIVWEVLLDNKPWEFGQESLHDAPWPSRDGYASERLFAMLQGGVDVSRAVARMIEAAGAPDKDIQPVLMADGATAREAQALLAFVPLAFGRMVLQSLPVHFSETALVRNDRGQQGTEILLSDDPIFARAQDLAADAWQATTFTQDEFLAVAMRSAEVHAVNQAIEQGAQACDLIVSPPTITLSPDDTASP
ncbi:MAG TPA: DUF6348 family protein [Polyangiaceae bacterium]|jgi:hypothetical protein|nr:DUF6348 family protein [Polyangiaceae bacterium]HNZ24987.1 DUF6348 family protein [Polyangiaceae bacterium]HOD23514.1 DUF6348 family protein [Polyangiaceae bacterium]HOE49711.1 DUF6348 family protein [Polyangiaceae bacterium]HOH03068.1 DUF6348 family protein [Polyangiaceae bacterium]